MAAMDNDMKLDKTDVKENTVKSPKRKMVVRRLRCVAILLVAFSIILLIVNSMQEKKDLGKRIDRWFVVRDSKFAAYSETEWPFWDAYEAGTVSDEFGRMLNFYEALNRVMANRYNHSSEEGELSLGGMPYVMEKKTVTYFDNIEPVEGDYEVDSTLSEDIAIITDADGDEFFVTSMGIFPVRYGYVYGKSLSTMGGDGSSRDYYFTFEAENPESRNNEDMKEAAEELFNKGNYSGWYKNYRYKCKYLEFTDEQRETFHISADEKYGSIQFYDASEELKEIRNHTINHALMLFGGDALILLVLFVLFSKEKAPVAETDPNSAFTKEEEKTEGISKDLTQRLLDCIEQSEKSYGPNGYLDEMRSLIEGETESN